MAHSKSDTVDSLRLAIRHLEADSSYRSVLRDETIQECSSKDSPQDAEDAVFKRITRLVAVRDRSCVELRKRLLEENHPTEAVEAALERAQTCGLIDDMRFADTLIRSRISQGRGKPGIEAELSALDIDVLDIAGWPSDYFSQDISELDRALALLDRIPPRAKNLRNAAYNKLIARGYSSSVATSASRIWTERLI